MKLTKRQSQLVILAALLFVFAAAGLSIAVAQTVSAQATSRHLVVPNPYKLLSYDDGAGVPRATLFVPDETDPQDDILMIENLARSITRQGRAFDLTVCTAPKSDAPFQDALYCRGEFFFDVRR